VKNDYALGFGRNCKIHTIRLVTYEMERDGWSFGIRDRDVFPAGGVQIVAPCCWIG